MALELSDLLLCKFSKDGDGPHFYNCWNLCREVYRRAGLFLPLYSNWVKTITGRDAVIRKVMNDDFLLLSKPEFMCVVGLKLHPKCITHMGVVISKRKFIHIRKNGVSIERLDNSRWIKRIEGLYRYVGNNKTQ